MPATRNRANSRALLAAAGLAPRASPASVRLWGQRRSSPQRSAPQRVAARQNRLSPGPAAMTTDSPQLSFTPTLLLGVHLGVASCLWRSRPRLAPSAQKQYLQRRDDEKQHDRSDQHAPNHHGGERTLNLAANSGRDCGRKQADAGRQGHHQDRPHLLFGGMEHCLDGVQASCGNLAIAVDDKDSAHNGNSEQRDESDGGGNAERQSGNVQSQNATADCKRNSEQSHETIAE